MGKEMTNQATAQGNVSAKRGLRKVERRSIAREFESQALSDAAALMLAVSTSALALEKLRHGTRQSITVRHLTVTRGGQAVVAGVVRK
jgi:hypothetical protein